MSAEVIAQFEDIKIRVKLVEDALEESFKTLVRNEVVQYERCSDYGKRGFDLMILFDEMNVSGFAPEKIQKVIDLLVKFKKLRLEQRAIERKLNEEYSVEQQLANSMRVL